MNGAPLRRKRLTLLGWVFGVASIPAILAWLVNLEQALRVFRTETRWAEALLPSGLYPFFSWTAADLSTISTMVVVLLLVFPAWMARRVLRQAEEDPASLHRLVYDPYPPHFPFFLVMLGLSGTLYGLLIGLSVSGVSELGAGVPSPDAIQQTLDQLLDGTATALLSSLLGLVGAFLSARPLTWLFHWAACLPQEEDRVGLSETLHRLTGDLSALSEVSRTFSEHLSKITIEDMPEQLGALRDELALVHQRLDTLLQSQQAGHDLLKPLTHLSAIDDALKRNSELQATGNSLHEETLCVQREQQEQQARAAQQALETQQQTVAAIGHLDDRLREMAGHLSQSNTLLSSMMDIQREQTGVLQQSLDEASDGRRRAEQQRTDMVTLLESGQRDREQDRNALRNAFQRFLENEPSKNARDGQEA